LPEPEPPLAAGAVDVGVVADVPAADGVVVVADDVEPTPALDGVATETEPAVAGAAAAQLPGTGVLEPPVAFDEALAESLDDCGELAGGAEEPALDAPVLAAGGEEPATAPGSPVVVVVLEVEAPVALVELAGEPVEPAAVALEPVALGPVELELAVAVTAGAAALHVWLGAGAALVVAWVESALATA
jgi:hypothetical protein